MLEIANRKDDTGDEMEAKRASARRAVRGMCESLWPRVPLEVRAAYIAIFVEHGGVDPEAGKAMLRNWPKLRPKQ